MSIKFYTSNDIITLKNNFISKFESPDPFSENLIIVPNINVKKWLQLELTKEKNIISGLNILYLESGLFYILKKIFDIDERVIFLNDKDNLINLQLLIILILLENEKENELAIFKKYYKKNNIEDFNALWSLSQKITYYLREYQYQKPDILLKWEEDDLYFKNNRDIENGYKLIYRKLFIEKDNYLERLNEKSKENNIIYTTLSIFVKKNLNKINIDVKEKFGSDFKIYIFGLSLISHFHIELLLKLSDYFEIEFYQLNYLNSEKNTYLDFYCNAYIKNKKLFDRIFNKKIDIIKNNKTDFKTNLLDSFKNCSLNNAKIEKIDQDETIQVIEAPTILREVETVYNSIIYNLLKDERLKLTDIAIFVPDMNKYRYYIENVFAQYGIIPYNINDFKLANESNFYRAINSFFEIVNSDFRKDRILKLITNPLFMKKFSFNTSDIENIIKLVDELNIFYSYNINDKKSISHFDTPYFTWGYGLTRLKLSTLFFNENEDRDISTFNIKNLYVADPENLEKVIKLFDELFNFFNSICEKRSFLEWKKVLVDFIENFLQVDEDDRVETILKDRTLSLLENIDKFENILLLNEKNDSNFSFEFIKKYILSNIEEVEGKKGSYLSDGVVISELQPMKPIPFKIAYILGLTENDFPGLQENSGIDLRNQKKNDEEFITKTENDRYLFFETILATQNKLYLLYNGKDLERDKLIYPSSVIREIIGYLEENVLKEKFRVYQVSLLLEDKNNFIDSEDKNFSCEHNRCYIPQKIETARCLYNNRTIVADFRKYNLFNKKEDSEVIKISIDDIASFFLEPKKVFFKNKLNLDITFYDKDINEVIEPFYEDKYDIENSITKYIFEYFKNNAINIEKCISEDIKYEREKGLKPEEFYSLYFKDKAIKNINDVFNFIKEKENFLPLLNSTPVDKEDIEYQYNYNGKSYLINGKLESFLVDKNKNKVYDFYYTDNFNIDSFFYKEFIKKIFILALKSKKDKVNSSIMVITDKKTFNFDINLDLKKIIDFYIKWIYERDEIFNIERKIILNNYNKKEKNLDCDFNKYKEDFEIKRNFEENENYNKRFYISDMDILIDDEKILPDEETFCEYKDMFLNVLNMWESRNEL
ncbi:MAG TPA: exodeoxyribonuclease V subunit gamma [Spirochaetota bacterium]|nr:exodeoxyribonuclease V subunit gamma [Spirochaetota bacterium]